MKFFVIPAEQFFFNTPANYAMSYVRASLKRKREHFSFDVAACGDAILSVFTGVRDYEITIKNGGTSQIKKMVDGELQEVATGVSPVALHCAHPTSFYIAWQEGELTVGAGLPLGSQFLHYRDDNEQITVLIVSLKTSQSEGLWDFDQEHGEVDWAKTFELIN